MKDRPSLTLFSAVTATTASPWMSPGKGGAFSFHFYATGTGTGTLGFETSDVDQTTFNVNPLAATNWAAHDMAAGTGVASGLITVDSTNGKPYKVKLPSITSRRVRWVFTLSTGSKTVSGWGTGL